MNSVPTVVDAEASVAPAPLPPVSYPAGKAGQAVAGVLVVPAAVTCLVPEHTLEKRLAEPTGRA